MYKPHHAWSMDVEMSKNCTPWRREAPLEVKMYKPHHARSTFGRRMSLLDAVGHIWKSKCTNHTMLGATLRCRKIARHFGAKHIWKSKCTNPTSIGALFGSCDVEKAHTGAARISKSKCAKHTNVGHFWTLRCRKIARRCGAKHIWKHIKMYKPHHASEHFWTLRCRKIARRCGAKHIWKSKCTNHTSVGALLDVEMSKNCTPVARSTFGSQNVQTTPASEDFWTLRCRKSARRGGAKHIWKSRCTNHTSVGAFLEVVMSKKRTPWRREAHFQVKMYKAHQRRTTFGR